MLTSDRLKSIKTKQISQIVISKTKTKNKKHLQMVSERNCKSMPTEKQVLLSREAHECIIIKWKVAHPRRPESNLYSHQEAKKKNIKCKPRFDWPPFLDHMPAHSSFNKKIQVWGIKSSVAERSLSQQNKERVKESKVCCTIGKKTIWNRIS